MKKLYILFLLISCTTVFSQLSKRDTLIKNSAYESLYSFDIGQPRRVIYKLYKGGGVCSRKDEGFHFKKDTLVNVSASIPDYSDGGYDEGHMANAEDFAYDCKKEELTFRFYNCIPQTPKLNRGIWKSNETQIRKLSQTDSLLIICGGIIATKHKNVKNGSKLAIPTYCYKVVISLSTHKLIQCLVFTNTEDPTSVEWKLNDLEYKVHFFFDRVIGFTIKN
jgi:DNA/RNA endonuclease G (NUC1)